MKTILAEIGYYLPISSSDNKLELQTFLWSRFLDVCVHRNLHILQREKHPITCDPCTECLSSSIDLFRTTAHTSHLLSNHIYYIIYITLTYIFILQLCPRYKLHFSPFSPYRPPLSSLLLTSGDASVTRATPGCLRPRELITTADYSEFRQKV